MQKKSFRLSALLLAAVLLLSALIGCGKNDPSVLKLPDGPPPPHAPSPLPSKTFPLIESLFAVFSKWQPELNDGSCLFVWD